MPDSGPKRWLFPLLWLPYALLAGRFWFVCDDAYISFRYARNLSHGLGLRYNLGVDPPVEGYTNFLWVLVCALIDRLGGEPAFWAPLISFVSGSLLLYLFWCILLREHRIAPPLAALATLGLGLFPPFAVWSTGGLASMPFCLALFASYFLLIYREGLRPTLLAGLCGLALVLLRFEGLGWALVVAGCGGFVRWRTGRSLRPVLGYLMLVLVGFSAYFVWRCGYHGHLWPNTVSTKVSFGPDVARIGWFYVATFGLTFLSPLLILPGSVGVWRNPDRIRLLPWAALVWGVCLYALLVGGDFMAMGRFLVLGVPFLFLLLPVLIAPRFDRSTAGKRLTLAAGVLVIVLGLLPAWNVHLVPAVVRERFKFRLSAAKFRSEVEQFQFMQDNAELWRQKGLALAECTLPGDSVVDEAIGAMGYYSDRFVFDRAGLVTRNLLEDYPMGRAVAGERSPGHTRSLPPEFFLPEEPTILRARFTRSGRPKQEIALLAREWRGSRVGQMYVADFREAVDLVGGGRLFVFQRRMQRGPAEEWAGFQERWAQLRD